MYCLITIFEIFDNSILLLFLGRHGLEAIQVSDVMGPNRMEIVREQFKAALAKEKAEVLKQRERWFGGSASKLSSASASSANGENNGGYVSRLVPYMEGGVMGLRLDGPHKNPGIPHEEFVKQLRESDAKKEKQTNKGSKELKRKSQNKKSQ